MDRRDEYTLSRSATLCIVTPRLLVRDLAEDDLAAVHASRADPQATRFMGFLPETLVESRAWLMEAIDHNMRTPRHAFAFGIVLCSDHRLIGWIGIGQSERDRTPGTLGFGYMLHSAHHGRGRRVRSSISASACCAASESERGAMRRIARRQAS